MAEATMDPELLDAQPPGEAPDPDDLLSKMIGDEVDSLLAEAEAARPAPAAPPEPTADSTEEVASAPDPAPAPTDDTSAADAAIAAAMDADIAAQVDKLVNATVEETPAAPPVAEAVAPLAAADPAAEADRLKVLATELGIDKSAPAADATSPTDPAADAAAITLPEGAAVSPDAALAADGTPALEIEDKIPLILRPLILINSPFAGFSDPMRSFAGKAAVVTLLNAIGVLTYVLVFRKHHQ